MRKLKLFFGSPGDLPEERSIVREVCNTLNDDPFVESKNMLLKPIGWEDAVPSAGRPQDTINLLQQDCDIFVCMLYKRYGTPTGGHDSGTEEEFLNAYESWKNLQKPHILFYFKNVQISSIEDMENEQLKKVLTLKKKIEKNEMLLFGTFDTPETFKKKLTDHLKKILSTIQEVEPQSIADVPPTIPDADIPQCYRNWLLDRTKSMDVDVIKEGSRVVQVDLPELYQPLYTTDPDRKIHDWELREQASTIDIEILAGKGPYLLIEGLAGSGKTTLMKHLARKIIQNQMDWADEDTLPVLVFLKDLKEFDRKGLSPNKESAVKLLDWYLTTKTACGLDAGIVDAFCKKGPCVFLLDGLDEAEPALRNFVADSMADYRLSHSDKVKVVLSGRPHGLVGSPSNRFGDKQVTVHPLTNPQVEAFIQKWFSAVYHEQAITGQDLVKKMIGELRTNNELDELKQNPLMLTAMCILYHDLKVLPDQRADLYDRLVERLFSKFDDEKRKVLHFMMELASTMMKKGDRGINEKDAVVILKNHFSKCPDESSEDMFRRIEASSGLMQMENGVYKFSHLSFQEFLTARFFHDTTEQSPLDTIQSYIADQRYREVVVLYIGFLSIRNSSGANSIVKAVLNEKPEPDFYRWLVVGKALLDIHKDNRKDDVRDLAQDRMLTIIRSNATPRILFEAGEILGRLGYQQGYKDFVPIAGGVYDLEKLGERTIDDFQISKYPVTNFWFREFIKGNGYEKDEYWTEEGWKWKQERGISEPSFINERRFNCPNSPGSRCFLV